MSITTLGNSDALLLGRTPCEVQLTDAIAAIVIVDWAFSWNRNTCVSQIAPCEASLDKTASSTAVIGQTAFRNLHASLEARAP